MKIIHLKHILAKQRKVNPELLEESLKNIEALAENGRFDS